MSNVKDTMWQRTLKSFTGDIVKLTLRPDRERIGRWASLEATSGVLRLNDGAQVTIDYSDILSCETAR